MTVRVDRDHRRSLLWFQDIGPTSNKGGRRHRWLRLAVGCLLRFAARARPVRCWVLAPFTKLTLTVDVNPEDGVSKAKIEEMNVALRELGMSEEINE